MRFQYHSSRRCPRRRARHLPGLRCKLRDNQIFKWIWAKAGPKRWRGLGAVSSGITVLYDTIRLEEKALSEAAKKKSIELDMVDCKNLVLELGQKTQFKTVLQRCVSYYRNLHATAALE